MATIARVPVTWTGLPGLPGVSVFYWDFAEAADLSALNAFFTAVRGLFADALSWSIPGGGDTIDDSDGTLNGSWIATGGGTIIGNGGGGSYPAGVGTRVRWNTAGIVDGRRVRGSTFMVPLLGANYDISGTIGSTPLTTLRNAATALATNGGLRIWSRNDPGSTNGSSNLVITASVPDQVATLRSRRF